MNNLQFVDTHLAIFLTQRKNDQFRFHSKKQPCPVAVIEKFIKICRHDSNSRLFHRILKTKKRMELRKEPMSYSWTNELIKQEQRKEGVNPGFYGIHSLRAGGAAAALGIPDRLFHQQGGWRSDKSKTNYIQEFLESLLKVIKAIQG